MTEWPIVPDSKSGVRATVPGVQIPLSPFYFCCKLFIFFVSYEFVKNLLAGLRNLQTLYLSQMSEIGLHTFGHITTPFVLNIYSCRQLLKRLKSIVDIIHIIAYSFT